MGVSYCGWNGLVQVLGDGLKLIFAWVVQSRMMAFVVGALWCIYSVGVVLWLELLGYGTDLGVLWMVILFGLGHAFLVLGMNGLSTSVWNSLGTLRLFIVSLSVELSLLLVLSVLDLYGMSVCVQREGGVCCLGVFALSVLLLLDAGRVPFDVTEAESELVAGIQTEYAGLCYALLASVEYSAVLLGTVLIVVILGLPCVGAVPLFCGWVWVRAVLPRFRFFDVVSSILPYIGCMCGGVGLLSSVLGMLHSRRRFFHHR
jgi:NADH:ubiquinone oxidoreductase subunit H